MAQITAAEFALEVESTPREVRKFLRADFRDRGVATPGKGARWTIEKREVRALAKRFAAWDEARKAVNEDDAPESPESD